VPILRPNALEFISHSPQQTRRVAMRLGARLEPGMVLALSGDLGSGKTTFVQGLAQGWGALDPVTSPTFILINVYRRAGGQPFFHLDAYRLAGPSEAWELDLPTLWDQGPLVVEWADRIEGLLPPDRMDIRFRWMDDLKRYLLFEARGPRALTLLQALRRDLLGS